MVKYRQTEAGTEHATNELVERQRNQKVPGAYRRARPAEGEQPAEVYSLRLPVERVAQLRRIADELGRPPTTLLREWVEAQLDSLDAAGSPSVVAPEMTLEELAGAALLAKYLYTTKRAPRQGDYRMPTYVSIPKTMPG